MGLEDLFQVNRRYDDFIDAAQERVHPGAPVRQVIIRFATVVIENDALAQGSCGENRGHGREQEGPADRAPDGIERFLADPGSG